MDVVLDCIFFITLIKKRTARFDQIVLYFYFSVILFVSNVQKLLLFNYILSTIIKSFHTINQPTKRFM